VAWYGLLLSLYTNFEVLFEHLMPLHYPHRRDGALGGHVDLVCLSLSLVVVGCLPKEKVRLIDWGCQMEA